MSEPAVPTSTAKPGTAWLALGTPIVGMLVVGLVSRVDGGVIGRTLLGMLGSAVGGVAAGVTAKRFLADGKTNGEVLFGLGATTAIGVIAVGYLYLFYIENTVQTILTLARNLEQTAIFVEFLTAQYAGTLWAQRWFPLK
ncbi:MAG TPA: hypothetical protein PLJ78_17245 [Anaerolineae bacterium]|nr:hypothetical protein [Anaerolineae bacterium]HQK15677.1 hypothetical protein [Anaerolineae bacterium]